MYNYIVELFKLNSYLSKDIEYGYNYLIKFIQILNNFNYRIIN